MDIKKQKLLIEYLISCDNTFAICNKVLNYKYFDPQYQNTIKFIQLYYNQYNSIPTPPQINGECNVQLELQTITRDQIEYCVNEIEQFCRRRALETAILDSVKLIEKGDYNKVEYNIKQAVLLSVHKDLGISYFDDVENRIRNMQIKQNTHPTGWAEIDKLLYGGINRKELLLVSANSGGGKSLTLANLAYNFIHNKLNVLYVSLELSEAVIAQRFDIMHTGINRNHWIDNIDRIVTTLQTIKDDCGMIDIIQMKSGTNANDIRSYLKQYELHYKIIPDLLIVDYLDKMSPNQRIDMNDVFTKDKLSSEQLRDIGVDYNMVVATASQLNRTAINAQQHNHSQIAGGISKINETDVYWSIIMNDKLRANSEILFFLQKTRNSDGVGKSVFLKWDPTRLRIIDLNKQLQLSTTNQPGNIKISKGKTKQTIENYMLGY